MKTFSAIVGGIVLVIGMILLYAALLAFPTKWLWNWLMTDLFSLKEITAWQALGLVMLCGILFKSSNSCSKS
jgi:hypothetical protein